MNFPLLAYTGPEPTQHRIFFANLVKDQEQICVDLGHETYEFLDFFFLASDNPTSPKDLEMKAIYLLVRNRKHDMIEFLRYEMNPWLDSSQQKLSCVFKDE